MKTFWLFCVPSCTREGLLMPWLISRSEASNVILVINDAQGTALHRHATGIFQEASICSKISQKASVVPLLSHRWHSRLLLAGPWLLAASKMHILSHHCSRVHHSHQLLLESLYCKTLSTSQELYAVRPELHRSLAAACRSSWTSDL